MGTRSAVGADAVYAASSLGNVEASSCLTGLNPFWGAVFARRQMAVESVVLRPMW